MEWPRPVMTNRLLASLPTPTVERLLDSATTVPFRYRESAVAQSVDDTVFFPLSGLSCLVTVMEDGGMVEAAMVGREGMGGGSTLPIASRGLHRVTLVPGEAVQVPPETFRQLLHEDHRLLLLVARYQEMLFRCSAQSAACNRVHPAPARLARWLATACIRNGAADLQVTQDFLASMLGVRRPTVTLAVGQLEEQGVITCRRGSIEVLDRDALLAQCCECFELIEELQARLFD